MLVDILRMLCMMGGDAQVEARWGQGRVIEQNLLQ